jgi:7-carboxy-7-deazaguanine synthase
MTIKYSELFYSCQGEGPFTGAASVWIRFWGCNLHCAGFGQSNPCDSSTYDMTFRNFDPIANNIKTYEELPIFAMGCDSEYSHNPKYGYLAKTGSVADVANKIVDLLPNKSFTGFNKGSNDIHLCITGGECMLRQNSVIALITELVSKGLKTVQIETNGTIPLNDNFIKFLKSNIVEVHFNISPKLKHVTGEDPSIAIKPSVIHSYKQFGTSACLKFVVDGSDAVWKDVDYVLDTLELMYGEVPFKVYAMPLGGSLEAQSESAGAIADKALQRGFYVSARVHVYLWGNKVGT